MFFRRNLDLSRWFRSSSRPFSSTWGDVQELDGEARALFVYGLSASSRNTYGAGKRRYLSFCARANLNPLPPSVATLCRFVAYLATEGLKAQSISGYLAAVHHYRGGFRSSSKGKVSSVSQPIAGSSAKAQETPDHSAGTVSEEQLMPIPLDSSGPSR